MHFLGLCLVSFRFDLWKVPWRTGARDDWAVSLFRLVITELDNQLIARNMDVRCSAHCDFHDSFLCDFLY